MTKLVMLRTALATIIGGLAPLAAALATDIEFTRESIASLAVGSILGAANAMASYLSKTVADAERNNP